MRPSPSWMPCWLLLMSWTGSKGGVGGACMMPAVCCPPLPLPPVSPQVRRSDVMSAWSGIRPLAVDPNAKDTASGGWAGPGGRLLGQLGVGGVVVGGWVGRRRTDEGAWRDRIMPVECACPRPAFSLPRSLPGSHRDCGPRRADHRHRQERRAGGCLGGELGREKGRGCVLGSQRWLHA